jgi:hypothetical protein
MMNEKDCTDDLMECTIECDTDDKECHTECVEDYHECVIPDDVHVDEGEIISEILTLTALLNGKCTRSSTLNSTGRSSKKITIEYDIQQRDKGSSEEA